MDIGIYGSYSRQSIGDHYILDGIIEQLEKDIESDVKFTVFSPSPKETERFHPSYNLKTVSSDPLESNNEMDTNQNNNSEKYSIRNKIKQVVKNSLDQKPNCWFFVDLYVASKVDFWKKRYDIIKDLDLLLIGGGNIVMDLFPYSCVFHVIYTELASYADTPVMYYAIGSGPLESSRAKLYYSRSINSAEAITTRDEESLALINRELEVNTSGTVAADPAVFLGKNIEGNVNKRVECHSPDEPYHVGVNVVSYYGEKGTKKDRGQKNIETYNEYIETMSSITGYLIEEKNAKITLFATNFPADLKPAYDIKDASEYNRSITICEEPMRSQEILNLLSQFDTVLCTRLHSLIPTFVSNTPFIAFSYQPKVHQFCKRIGLGNQAIDLELEKEAVIKQTKERLNEISKWNGEIPDYQNLIEEAREDASVSSQLAKSILV